MDSKLLCVDCSKWIGVATVITLVFVNTINYVDRYTISAVIEPMKRYFEVEDSPIGFLQTTFLITYMISSPIFGYLGDRYNRKLILLAGMAVWTANVLLSSFVTPTQFGLFMTSRGILGICQSAYVNIAPTLIADLYTGDMRSRMLMIYYFAIPVGSGLGFLIGGCFAHIFNDWQWGIRVGHTVVVMKITTFATAIATVLVLVVVPNIPNGQAEKSVINVNRKSWRGFVEDLQSLQRCSTFIWVTLGNSSVAFASAALSHWGPTLVIRSKLIINTDDSATSSITTLFGIITVLGGLAGVGLGTSIAQHWRKKNPRADPLVCAIGMLVSGSVCYVSLNLIHINLLVAWVLIFVCVTTLSFNWAIVPDIVMYVSSSERKATANAICTFFQHFIGGASSTYIVGQTSDMLKSGSLGEISPMRNYRNLLYSMYITSFVMVIGGFCFLMCAMHIEQDKLNANTELQIKASVKRKNAIVPMPDLPIQDNYCRSIATKF